MKKIVFAIMTIATSLQAQCPPEAITSIPCLSVGAYRQSGLPIGPGYVRLGETILFQTAVGSHPWDWMNDTPACSFFGGRLTINGANATPAQGVGLVGTTCGGAPFCRSEVLAYVVGPGDVQAGRILVRGVYTGGISEVSGMSVSCSALALVKVAR